MEKQKDEKIAQVNLPHDIITEDFEVKTIPQKFLSVRPSSAGHHIKLTGTKKTVVIGVAIVVALGILMILAAWLFLRSVEEDEQPLTITPIAEVEEPVTTGEPEDNPPPVEDNSDQDLLILDTWTHISNDPYGYKFKYPSQWTKEDILSNYPTAKEAFSLKGISDTIHLTFAVFSTSEEESLEDWLNTNSTYSDQSEIFELADVSAYKYIEEAGGYSIYSRRGENIFNLIFTKPKNQTLSQVYTQILANFEFTGEDNLSYDIGEYPDDGIYDVQEFFPASDLDNDDLSDLEENLFGTDENNADTDGDSYADGLEVTNVYDPLIVGDAKLFNSNRMATFINNKYKYNLLYPLAWEKRGTEENAYFYAPTDEFIAVIVEPNQGEHGSIEDWYFDQYGQSAGQNQEIQIDNMPGLKSEDDLRAHVMLGDNIYSFIYNAGLRQDINFLTTFNMIISSFKLMH